MGNDQVEDNAKQFIGTRTVVFTAILSALGFVLALFWNDAIKSAIEILFPTRETVLAKLIAAVIVTVIVIFLVYVILHANRITTQKVIEELRRQNKMLERKNLLRRSKNL
ncbi:MAG TPA: DUF5654 family protein [archaeon]|nr:DUF5654 family protein [archaeon]